MELLLLRSPHILSIVWNVIKSTRYFLEANNSEHCNGNCWILFKRTLNNSLRTSPESSFRLISSVWFFLKLTPWNKNIPTARLGVSLSVLLLTLLVLLLKVYLQIYFIPSLLLYWRSSILHSFDISAIKLFFLPKRSGNGASLVTSWSSSYYYMISFSHRLPKFAKSDRPINRPTKIHPPLIQITS